MYSNSYKIMLVYKIGMLYSNYSVGKIETMIGALEIKAKFCARDPYTTFYYIAKFSI